MLCGLGIILLLMSAAFVGGSVAIPVAIAGMGIVLMSLGRRTTNGKKNAAR
jgi:hypothetical protein